MNDTNRSYRIRTEVGNNVNINVNLDQDYNTFEILSLKLTQEDAYRLQSADYGVIVGRVLANGGFGIPNAKISVFISATTETRMDVLKAQLYPYQSTQDRGDKGIRYNLLPDQDLSDCHRAVGTFPSKTFVLDNDDVIEIFEEYYKYTTKTNNAGDYMICGVPTGDYTVHMDLDLSDCGMLSQRPRDFYYKGYTVEQFENPNVFKSDDELDTLSQIFSQDQTVEVIPFWGNTGQGDQVGISRCDINVNYKFEPTCVFLGSVFTDNSSNGISKKCIATNTMGAMDELITGEGTIEMIRKTPSNTIEEFAIKGTELINSDGIWCYQIPMNLDYITTDEYGNTVATDNPEKGIPTRTSVRFRISLHDNEQNTHNYFLSKVLVPNNPKDETEKDFNFGTQTKDTSFRDMFWNNVYSIKSFIPRFQQSGWIRSERFTGLKHTNNYSNNNPMPYNNIRIRLPLMFIIMCAIIKIYISVVGFVNNVIGAIALGLAKLAHTLIDNKLLPSGPGKKIRQKLKQWTLIVLEGDLCPDLEGWYFAPVGLSYFYLWYEEIGNVRPGYDLWKQTYNALVKKNTDNTQEDEDEDASPGYNAAFVDKTSIDSQNSNYVPNGKEEPICLTREIDYLLSCVEMNLAQEYRVINFDFYNDWINGTIYIPRWNKFVRKKRNYLWGLIKVPLKIKGCLSSSHSGNGSVSFGRTRKYTQQCSLGYSITNSGATYSINTTTDIGCKPNKPYDENTKTFQKCHGAPGFKYFKVFGSNGGVIQEKLTSKEQYVYYAKPCEWHTREEGSDRVRYKANFFATDLILLGSLNDCDKNGLPQAFNHLVSTSYKMPTNLAQTNLDSEGYLYGISTSDGTVTICSEPKGTGYTDTGVSVMEKQTYENVRKFFSGDTNTAVIEYTDLDDYITLTEAPGIAWNYSGPEQGKSFFTGTSLYQPGGLFLGISCFNSQTNIKSCVNLARACEIGVALNPRKETVKGVNYSPTTGSTFVFNYYVPTGIINNKDILDDDFRMSFATLNHRRLIATGTAEKTGYPTYEFKFLNPNAFDGLLKKKVIDVQESDAKTWYNGTKVRGEMKNEVGIVAPGLDYDKDIVENTQTQTLDTPSQDYYRFRFGIDNLSLLKTKFAEKKSGSWRFPLYENSFYFYFGLHPGATALDEFNKQYFSSCEKKSDIDESGYYYKQIDSAEISGETVLVYASIPENPTSQYPIYIKVGNTYYKLEADSQGVEKCNITWSLETPVSVKTGDYLDIILIAHCDKGNIFDISRPDIAKQLISIFKTPNHYVYWNIEGPQNGDIKITFHGPTSGGGIPESASGVLQINPYPIDSSIELNYEPFEIHFNI